MGHVVSRYQPWLGGAFRWRLGVRPLEPRRWFEFGDDAPALLRRKREVLATNRDTAFRALEGVERDCGEVLDEIVEHLAAVHPDVDRHVDPSEHPLVAAARLVPEDLVVMTERDGQLVFAAGVVCFPNRWDLASKLGLPLREVHAPVARLNDQLAAPIDAFFERLTPERSFWRLGWGLIETPELYQPLDGTAAPRDPIPAASEAGRRVWVRVERETLRRFARTGVVVFTIRTHLTRLDELADRPDDLARLGDAVGELPPDVAAYKGTAPLTAPVLEWLTSRSTSTV